MDKQTKIITICLFAVNFIIGKFIGQSEFSAMLGGFFSVCVYWFGDYYCHDVYLRILYKLHKHDESYVYAYIYPETEEAQKYSSECIDFDMGLHKLCCQDKSFEDSYSEFMNIIEDMQYRNDKPGKPWLNYFVHNRAYYWLMAFGYSYKNLQQLKEDLPTICVRLRNIEMRKALDTL